MQHYLWKGAENRKQSTVIAGPARYRLGVAHSLMLNGPLYAPIEFNVIHWIQCNGLMAVISSKMVGMRRSFDRHDRYGSYIYPFGGGIGKPRFRGWILVATNLHLAIVDIEKKEEFI
jgi:hypothetical protein